MISSRAYKNLKKQKDREATIKHYLLGYLLECVQKRDIEFMMLINDFVVKKLKVIDESNFDNCLFKLTFSTFLIGENTRDNYRRIKSHMKIKVCDMETQINVINNLKVYADSYKNGKYIKARMIESSYL